MVDENLNVKTKQVEHPGGFFLKENQPKIRYHLVKNSNYWMYGYIDVAFLLGIFRHN